MRTSPVFLCLSLMITSCTGQARAGFAINPIRAGGAGMGGGIAQPGGVVDVGMTSNTGMDMTAGGSGSMGVSGEQPVPSGAAEVARGAIDPNLVGWRENKGFPGDTGLDMGAAGGGFVDTGTGFDSTGSVETGNIGGVADGAGTIFDTAGGTGMGFDANTAGGAGTGFNTAGGTGMGFDANTAGGARTGFDTAGGTGMGFDANTAGGARTGFDTAGGTGMGFDANTAGGAGTGFDTAGGTGMGFDANTAGGAGTGFDTAGGTEMGFDTNTAGGAGTGFDTAGGTGTGFGMMGGTGMGLDAAGGTEIGLDAMGDPGMGLDVMGGTGFGIDPMGDTGMMMVSGAGTGIDFGTTGDIRSGFDTMGGTGMDMSMVGGDFAGGPSTSETGPRGAVAAGVPDRVRVETGPRETDTAVANEAATLLRGLLKETSNFDAASEPTAPGAVEHHSMIAGPPNEPPGFTDSQPIVHGDMPTGAIIKTTKEEKSSFSVSGESSFEHFSSVDSGPKSSFSGSRAVDLNPVAAGANVQDSGRSMMDFPGDGAAATAVDTSRTDAATAGADRSAIGTIDASATAADGGAVDVQATGAREIDVAGSGTGSGAVEGVATGGLDLTATGRDGTTAGIKVVGGKKGEITGDMWTGTGAVEGTAGGVVDASVTGPAGGRLDLTGGVIRDGTVSGGIDSGIGGSGTVAGAGKVSVETPGGAGFDIVRAGKQDTSVAGDLGVGMGGEVGMAGTDPGVGVGTATADMGIGSGGMLDMGMTSGIGTDMSASGSGSVGISGEQVVPAEVADIAQGVIDSNLVGGKGDLGTGFGDTGAGMGSDLGFGLGAFEGTAGGGVDASMTGPDGGRLELTGGVMRDGTVSGGIDSGIGGTGTVAGAGKVSVETPGGAGFDIVGAGKRETSVAGDLGVGMGGVVGSTGMEPAVDMGTDAAGFGIGKGGVVDVGMTSDIGMDMSASGSGSMEVSGEQAVPTGVADIVSGAIDPNFGVVDTGTGMGGGLGDTGTGQGGDLGFGIGDGRTSDTGTGIDAGFGVVPGTKTDALLAGADGSANVDAGFGVEGTLTGADSGRLDFTGAGRRDTAITGETGVGFEGTGSVSGAADLSFTGEGGGTIDVTGASRKSMTGDIGAGSGVVDMGAIDRSRADRRVLDALSAVTGQMDGTAGTDSSFTADRQGAGVIGVGANVLDRDRGIVDFPNSGAAATVGETRRTDTGQSEGIFGWAGEGTRRGASTGDLSMTGGRSGSLTLEGGGVRGGGVDGSLSIDKSGSISGTGSRGDASFGIDGSGRTSVTRQGSGTVGGGVDGSVSFRDRGMIDFPSSGAAATVGEKRRTDTGQSEGIFGWAGEGARRGASTGDLSMTGGRSGSLTVEGGGSRGGGVDGSLSIDQSGSISGTGSRGDASFGIDGSGRTSVTGHGSGTVGGGVDGSVSIDRTGQISGTGATNDGSLRFEGDRATSITGEKRDGFPSVSGERRGSGSVSIDGTGGMSGTGSFGGRVSGELGGFGGEAGAVAGSVSGKGSAQLSLEDRTVREGEWSATWNYEGAVPEWFRHRVNPAPCRRFGCNLASCYVPHPRDCKSYIVCQRTALGTYVATRMRCAFGTVWAASNLWTCVGITALTVGQYECPNDPCRDPQLTKYPDEDFHHCKIFWTCRNGRSIPECCPPGTRFHRDQLTCVDDPNETCQAECPLKQERCSLTGKGPAKQPHYDGNCKTYWDCGTEGAPHPVCCPDGYSFEAGTGTCVESVCTDLCPPEYNLDVCGKVGEGGDIVTSYPMKDNCRTFIKCDPKDGRIAACCRADYFYNKDTMACERILDYLDPCRQAICPQGYQEECRFNAVKDRRKMFDIDAGIERSCGLGTVFDKKICNCVHSNEPFKKICKKEVDAQFDHINEKWNVHNYGDGWISTYAALPKNVTANGNHFATFDGRMGLEVPRYDHNRFHEFTLKVTFQPVNEMAANGNRKQTLVNNCQTTEVNGGPSFMVTLDPATSMITFTGRSDTETSVVELQYNQQDWNTYTLLFEGENVLAMIEDPNVPGKADSSSTRLKGPLLRGMGPLVFGPCKDNNSRPKKNGFVGFMSEVIFAKCLDEASRMFMRETLDTTLGPGV